MCLRDGVNVRALAESPVLSQISVPFLLKEREELGKFYLFKWLCSVIFLKTRQKYLSLCLEIPFWF